MRRQREKEENVKRTESLERNEGKKKTERENEKKDPFWRKQQSSRSFASSGRTEGALAQCLNVVVVVYCQKKPFNCCTHKINCKKSYKSTGMGSFFRIWIGRLF